MLRALEESEVAIDGATSSDSRSGKNSWTHERLKHDLPGVTRPAIALGRHVETTLRAAGHRQQKEQGRQRYNPLRSRTESESDGTNG